MRELTDRGYFLIYGIGASAFAGAGTAYIVGLFLAVAVSSCALFLKNRTWAGILLGLYCAGLCLWPEASPFLPLMVLNMLEIRMFALLPLAAAALVRGAPQEREMPVYLLLGIAGACLLWARSRKLTEREEELRRTQDDGTEQALLLEQRNLELREKQDYEMYAATLKERNRIAREIHDNVGHLLSRSILMTGALKAVNQIPALETPVQSLEDTLKEAMDSIRRSVHDLHDDSVNLKEAAEGLVRDFTFCRAELAYGMGTRVPGKVKYCFLAVVKEALSNIMKHSDAREVRISMQEHPAFYQLEIRDDGTAREEREKSGGIGLLNMGERVKHLGGICKISREKGFRIFISIPKGDE